MATDTEIIAVQPDTAGSEAPAKYRTKKRAANTFPIPEIATTITHPDYAKALKNDDETSSGIKDTTAEEILLADGETISLDGVLLPLTDSQHISQYFKGPIAEADKPLLAVLFTITWAAIKAQPETFISLEDNGIIKQGAVRVYIPELMDALGLSGNRSEERIDQFVEKIKSLHSGIGILRETTNKRTVERHVPLLSMTEYNKTDNTLAFSSPYLMALCSSLFIPRYKEITRNKRKTLLEIPPVTTMISNKLYGERSTRAIEIVEEIVVLVVTCGQGGTPRIKIRTLINRIDGLAEYINDPYIRGADKNKALSRAFTAAWKYLRKYTYLEKKYKDIELPTIIPTMTMLDKNIEIPHKGRINK